MARSYETVLIFDSTLDESVFEQKLDRLKGALVDDGDESMTVTQWGTRKLAYPIGKKEQGTYVILRYDTEPDRLVEFERLAKLDEQVMRQLTIVDPIESTIVPAATSTDEPAAMSTDEPAAMSTDEPAAMSTDEPTATSTDEPAEAGVEVQE
jgi:small subunit ribosomal protein S6